MTEKHIVIEDIEPMMLYGVGNSHLQVIKSLYPKLRIVVRGNVVKVLGDEEQMAVFEEDLHHMIDHVLRFNTISDEDIVDIAKGIRTKDEAVKGVVVYSLSGRPIKSRSENQQRLTKRIILSRPAVEAGEKLGFLPGDMKDKIDPYLQPLYDALEDMLPATKLQDMMEKHIIQIAPLAFMRGRTLSDAIVILDEAQNTTPAQLRMFLTRMGWNTKMVITGDMTQIDLPRSQTSGLREALRILHGIEGIGVVELNKKDIVRHKLVTRIVNAYEAADGKQPDQEEQQQ